MFLGSAYKNKGVQLLLDAVTRYLPSPLDRTITAKQPEEPGREDSAGSRSRRSRSSAWRSRSWTTRSASSPSCAIYQGTVKKGEMYFNQRTGKKERFSRIVKMHADKREEIDAAEAGDIVAIMGIDCASGDTYAGEPKYCTLESMFVAEPVIKMSINPRQPRRRRSSSARPCSASARKTRRSTCTPTKRPARRSSPAWASCTSRSTSSASAASTRSRSKSARRRSATAKRRPSPTAFDYKHKKQTGGSGQYAHIVGVMGPMTDEERAEAEGRAAVRRQGRPAAAFRRTSSPPSKRASATCWTRARSPASRSSASSSSCRTARTTTSTARTWRSMLTAQELLPRDVPEDEAGAARADHDGRNRSAPSSSRARSPATLSAAAA